MTRPHRCDQCAHFPGLGSRCELTGTFANRHRRRCPSFAPFVRTCVDCWHRGATGTCYQLSNARRELVRVEPDAEACPCFTARRAWRAA